MPYLFDHTTYFHPQSRDFLSEVQKGILLSNAEIYANNPKRALKDQVLLGMTDGDVETLNKLNQYFNKAAR